MTQLNFRANGVWGEILMRWWHDLDNDTGGRAALRRAPDITAIVLQPAFQRLHRRLLAARWPDRQWENDGLAAAAGLLAHVKVADAMSLPESMSQRNGEKPRVSELRFKRLLECPDVETLFVTLRRTLPLVEHRCDPLALTTDVVNWGDAVRKRWAYAYDWPDRAGD